MGREARSEFGEGLAPEQADKKTLGSSVQWYSVETKKNSRFPMFEYGIKFDETNAEQTTKGEWTWETGMNQNQIDDFERIRDYGLLVIYSNWSFLKNRLEGNEAYRNRRLGWVAYIAGKRESRRLLGDYILKEDDLRKNVFHEDASFSATWSIDLHWEDPDNSRKFPGREFKSVTEHILIYPYAVPYRCLYSRNIENLFMAGRDISATHVALGSIRVMRTTGMMGEVVGMAASLCKRFGETPRGIYQHHLDDLKTLMTQGVGGDGFPNNQRYNEGGRLKGKPQVIQGEKITTPSYYSQHPYYHLYESISQKSFPRWTACLLGGGLRSDHPPAGRRGRREDPIEIGVLLVDQQHQRRRDSPADGHQSRLLPLDEGDIRYDARHLCL